VFQVHFILLIFIKLPCITFSPSRTPLSLPLSGEELFALPQTNYPELGQTQKEVKLADQLFTLYVDVLGTLNDWKGVLWCDVTKQIGAFVWYAWVYMNCIEQCFSFSFYPRFLMPISLPHRSL
jgi:hypothetical protein